MILVLNCGSSSVKYRGYPDGKDGLVERIGEPGGDAPDHATALRSVLS
ncbi:MAG TPA: acetate kinase, partial [Micromonosporaceae bacterium]|nr:acetate kinase [Micromonosporaceae bacterium]